MGLWQAMLLRFVKLIHRRMQRSLAYRPGKA